MTSVSAKGDLHSYRFVLKSTDIGSATIVKSSQIAMVLSCALMITLEFQLFMSALLPTY